MHQRAVDLELIAFGHVGRAWFEAGAVEDAAVAVGFALEAERQFEILVALVSHQVAVALGHADAVNGRVFDGPMLGADINPTGEVFPVENGHPSFVHFFEAGLRGGGCGQRQGQNPDTHLHAPISFLMAVAMRLVNSSTRARSGPSTMTRATGSVPEKRTSTR